ncbi:hypothetical protein ACWV95_10170 [Streptomyces albus]
MTHDPVEAVSLADRVLVLEDGRAVQDAPPGEVARHPKSPWVARMLGRNALAGTAAGDGTLLLDDGGKLVVADPVTEGAAVLAVVAPEAVALHRTAHARRAVRATCGRARYGRSRRSAAGCGCSSAARTAPIWWPR